MRMFKRIGTKRYDTAAATLVATCSHASSYEELYRKRSGEYFLHTGSGEGDDIKPLTYDQVGEWEAKNHKIIELYSHYQPDTRSNLTLSLSGEAIRDLRRMASEQGKPMSQIVEEMILGRKEQV
jgi:hypothetical protein